MVTGMTRPTYETSSDVKHECEVALKVATDWGIQVVKLKPKYPCDWAFVWNGEVTGYMEIKCRTHVYGAYPTYLISAEKIRYALTVWREFEIPVVLVVAWTDFIGYIKVRPPWNYKIRVAGRTDREDEQDVEPCFFIPCADFKEVEPE